MILISLALVTQAVKRLLLGVCFLAISCEQVRCFDCEASTKRQKNQGLWSGSTLFGILPVPFGRFAAIQSLCYLLGQFRCSNNRHFPTSPRMSVNSRLTNCWLVGCIGLNGPLRQYFSLYRTVSQRGGERG